MARSESSLKFEERTIDGVHFSCTQHHVRRWLRLRARLLRILGPTIQNLIAVGLGGDITPAQAIAALMSLDLTDVFAKLTDDEAEALWVEILHETEADDGEKKVSLSVKENFDRIFASRLLTIDKAVMFALEVNFRDFLLALRSEVESVAAEAKKAEEAAKAAEAAAAVAARKAAAEDDGS